MKLKYYLRGLGIGIIVTAVLMSISAGSRPAEMTDAQIVARAKELGMVDGVLSELETPESDETEQQKPETDKAQEETKAPEKPEADKSQEETKAPEKPETDKAQEETKAPEKQEADKAQPETKAPEKPEPEVVSKIIVTIYPGEGSYTVSRKLAALGLVESADIYDKFLCQNGYDKKLITGNHEIEAGMTADEIAKALTTR